MSYIFGGTGTSAYNGEDECCWIYKDLIDVLSANMIHENDEESEFNEQDLLHSGSGGSSKRKRVR